MAPRGSAVFVVPEAKRFRKRLLTWYRVWGRSHLPWRGRFEPYRVMVSEFMLQQTTVGTVIPYFHRFLRSFPTFKALARAPLEKVLERWSGLGYYARARNLHRAAQLICARHGSRLPDNLEALRALPGVGPYTAGALLSFAHDLPAALVDGNVARVFSRVFGIRQDVKKPATVRRLWVLADTLAGGRGMRHVNSALMDFGALICRSADPACSRCPLRAICWAFSHGAVNRLPVQARRTISPVVTLAALALFRGKRLFLRRRPPKGLWGGLWEFPWVEGRFNARAFRAYWDKNLGFTPRPLRKVGQVRHVLSHRDFRVTLWAGRAAPGGRRVSGGWFLPQKVREMAISALSQKLLTRRGTRGEPIIHGDM